jgi:hypothetical protein
MKKFTASLTTVASLLSTAIDAAFLLPTKANELSVDF